MTSFFMIPEDGSEFRVNIDVLIHSADSDFLTVMTDCDLCIYTSCLFLCKLILDADTFTVLRYCGVSVR